MIRNVMKHEFDKLISSRSLYISLFLGTVIVIAHFVQVILYVNEVYFTDFYNSRHPSGLDGISLLALTMSSDAWFISSFLFFILLPILASFPFASSLYKERSSGYQLQIIARIGKIKYLFAKLIACAASGFITIMLLQILDAMLCALVCPLTSVHVLSLVSGVWDGSFCEALYYNHPLLYIVAEILMSSVWGAVWAVVSLSAEMFISSTFLINISSFTLMMILTFAMEYMNGLILHVSYEIRPLYLQKAECGNFNPGWYIFLWQLGFLVLAAVVYYLKGMKRENL